MLRVVSSFQESPVIKGLKLQYTSDNVNPRGTKFGLSYREYGEMKIAALSVELQ